MTAFFFTPIFAAEVPDALLAGVVALGVAVFIGLASWALLMLVRLTGIVAGLEARIEERSADHERRLTALEVMSVHRPFSGGVEAH
jgi:hypothetical protein